MPDFGDPRTGEGERKVPPGAVVRRYRQGKVVGGRKYRPPATRRRRRNTLRPGSFRNS